MLVLETRWVGEVDGEMVGKEDGDGDVEGREKVKSGLVRER